MRSPDINAEGVVHALQLAGDTLRFTTATPDQLNAAAAFLAKALARFPERSGSVLGILGAVLSSRSVLRFTREERMRIRNMRIIEHFTPSEHDDQERDSVATQLGVVLLLLGTLLWAYGDLLPELW